MTFYAIDSVKGHWRGSNMIKKYPKMKPDGYLNAKR